MNNLESLNLTSKDFDLLVQGLDALPNKGEAADLMVSLLGGMLAKDNDEAREKWEKSREKEKAKKEGDRLLMIEEVKILQGKLLMLKRYLMENKLLADAQQIISQ